MIDSLIAETQSKSADSYDVFISNLNSVRTGVATPSLLDGVLVDAYGSKTKLNQIASISAADSKTLLVTAWDSNNISAIKDAIMRDLGLNAFAESSTVRVNIPPLTEDRRKDLVKVVNGYTDRAKITLRSIRGGCISKIKSMHLDKAISEDQMHAEIKKVEKIISGEEKKINLASEKKKEEILRV